MNTFLAPLATTLVALAVYGLTLAPDLAWANFGSDGGELITTAVTLGVPHPSGYPTYVLLGKLFSWLPLGTVAYRLNLFSAVCVALAAGLVTAVNQRPAAATAVAAQPASNPLTAAAAGLTFALAPLVWGQALISEVYGLNLLCLALFLWTLWTARPPWLVGVFLGLSLTTHLTSLFMLPLALFFTPGRRWPPLAAGFVAGLAPFLLLPLLAQSGSPVIWGRPDTLSGWWWLVSGQIYRANLFTTPAAVLVPRLREWAVVLPGQFLWAGFVMIGAGVVKAAIAHEAARHVRLPITVLATAVFYLVYALGYNTPDAIIYTLPALLLCAMLLGLGLRHVGAWALALPLCLLLLNFQAQNLQREGLVVRPLAQQLLQQAPTNALLLSADEATTFTLWYFHYVERERPDIVVVDTNLFAFDWYRDRLRAQYPGLFVPIADDLPAFYAGNEAARPLCPVQILRWRIESC